MKIPIIATSLLKFGEIWDKGINELIKAIGNKVLDNAKISSEDVDAAYISNLFSSKTNGQSLLSSIVFDELKINNSVCISCGDASGAVAIKEAANSIISGQSNIAIVIGVEKITDFKLNDVLSLSSELIGQDEAFVGATVQSQFAIITRKYLNDFKLNAENLSFIPYKNHKNALSNEYAQYKFELPEDKINSSPMFADPIRMFDCASYCDGAAAIIMCNEKIAKKFHDVKGYLLASSIASDSSYLSKRKNITSIESTSKAAELAYNISGLEPNSIDLMEVFDLVPISEVLAVEDLGFAKKGEGIKFIKDNLDRINLSGGLKACGHAIGATGIRQAVDLLNKLKTNNLNYGLTHTIAGTGGLSVVNIYGSG